MSIEKPTDDRREDLRARLRSMGMSDEQIDDFWRQVDSGQAYMVAPLKTYDVPPFEPKQWPVVTQGQFIKLVEPAPVIDWSQAPEGATHRYPGGLWYKFDFEADTAHYCRWGEWVTGDAAHVYVADGSLKDMIARPTAPQEKWSLNGENGAWDYDSLAELIKDNYGHGRDSAGPMGGDDDVVIGSTVYRAIEHKDDPAGFLPDAGQITEIMFDNAASSDAGEWVDAYPELDDEATAALAKALEPLKAWARKHCQPKFFTVKDITQHTVTAEDVRAAQ